MSPRDIPATPGIYRIRCISTGRFYVGSAINLYSRWIKHRSQLRQNRHFNPKLQAAWNKYTEPAFIFEILELVLIPETLTAREQHFLDTLKPFGKRGFNFAPVAGSRLGTKQPPEAIEKIRAINLGRKFPAEFGEKISQRQLGSKFPPERRKNISNAKRGKPSPHRGKKKSPEAIENQRRALTGYKHTEEAKRNMGNSHRGSKRTVETKEKIRAASIGHAPTNVRTFVLTSPDGTEYTVNGLPPFCREHNLNPATLIQVARGNRTHHKGWTARYLESNAG